jgi:hypothetical protein
LHTIASTFPTLYRVASFRIFEGAPASLDSGIIGGLFPHFSRDATLLLVNALINTLKFDSRTKSLDPVFVVTHFQTWISFRFVRESAFLLIQKKNERPMIASELFVLEDYYSDRQYK